MSRSPKTRFLEDAIVNGLDSATSKFPSAFSGDELAELVALSEPDRKGKLQELFTYWQAVDEVFDD